MEDFLDSFFKGVEEYKIYKRVLGMILEGVLSTNLTIYGKFGAAVSIAVGGAIAEGKPE